jgi:hypothetical protein
MAQGHAAIAQVIPVALQDQHSPELLRELIADLLAEREHLAIWDSVKPDGTRWDRFLP